jgi:hypothetical protein
MAFLADFFVSEARRSTHKYVDLPLIYDFEPRRTPNSSHKYEQTYVVD